MKYIKNLIEIFVDSLQSVQKCWNFFLQDLLILTVWWLK